MRMLSEKELKELTNRFTYHPPQGDQVQRYEAIRKMAHDFALLISACCPQSRELSTALTQLHLAVLSANAAIACNEP